MAKGNKTMLAWDHWHIEASSICSLACPRCPRAELPDNLLNRQLTLSFFQKQIGADVVVDVVDVLVVDVVVVVVVGGGT